MSVTKFDDMLGRTMVSVTGATGGDEMLFTSDKGDVFRFAHDQDCCESVEIEDIVGDLSDLCGVPILEAEESSEQAETKDDDSSGTWTFFRYSTIKGTVTVRWFGTSNGYYSETADYSVQANSPELKQKQTIARLVDDVKRLQEQSRHAAGKYEIDKLGKRIEELQGDVWPLLKNLGELRCTYRQSGKEGARCTRPHEHWLHGSPEHRWEK